MKRQDMLRVGPVCLLATGALLLHALQAQGAVRYIKADATGANNGTNWADAYASLRSALAAACQQELKP